MNVDLLKNIPLFTALGPADLEELAAYLKRESCPSNHTIFWMEEKGEHLYIIQSGQVQIISMDDNGKEIILATLGAGSFFGELSLIDGGTHSATARTTTDCVFFTLDRSSFYHFLEKHPGLAQTVLYVLASRLRSSTVKIRGIRNVNEELEAKQSPFQQSIDRLAKALTSGVFISISFLFVALWIAAQTWLYKKEHHVTISFADRPPTFYILGFLITLTSFLLTILILNSQRRQAENDRVRGEIEYQINLKSQTEVMRLHLKIDRLLEVMETLSRNNNRQEEGPREKNV